MVIFDDKLNIMCDPKTHKPLHLDCKKGSTQYFLTDAGNSIQYPIVDGIVYVLQQGDVVGRNERYQKLYDKIARWYALLCRAGLAFYRRFFKKKFDAQWQIYNELIVKPGDNVLEVSVGTGLNFKFLPREITLFGLDISRGMLKQCYKACQRDQIPAVLVHGMAEALPFKDESFDVVFHVGGINFFTDMQEAINEMIRVAKPGTKIFIVDETEKTARYAEKLPIGKWFFKDREPIVPPIDLIPKQMKEIHMKLVNDDAMYVISFVKP